MQFGAGHRDWPLNKWQPLLWITAVRLEPPQDSEDVTEEPIEVPVLPWALTLSPFQTLSHLYDEHAALLQQVSLSETSHHSP